MRNNREECQYFELEEKLFRRFTELLEVEGHLYPNSVQWPDFSVNREKFSQPEDVLLPNYPECGVCAFRAKHIPTPFEVYDTIKKTNNIYEFCVWHAPLEHNYSHSEVRGLKNNQRVKDISSKMVKKKFRFKLSEKLEILINSK